MRRRGATAIIAMLYLVLFSSLAIGFVAATQTAVQVSYNEDAAQRALLAAESGMDFVRFHLQQLQIDRRTRREELMDEVFDQLSGMMNGSPNLGGRDIALMDDGTIIIPGPVDQWVLVNDDRGRFRATITQVAGTTELSVRVAGSYKDAVASARGVQLNFGINENRSSVFDFGIAARGPILTGGASRIRGETDPKRGSILSASGEGVPVNIGGKEVSGSISITNPNGSVRYSGATVGGTRNSAEIAANHIHKGVAEPDFPIIDAEVFLPFVKNTYSGGRNIESVRIPANTNPTFAGGSTLNGVIYVETPNRLTFRGNTTINGIIVVENDPRGSAASNVMDFAGNVSGISVKNLTRSHVPSLNAAELAELRKMTGSFILAHGFHTSFTGSFESISGSIMADQISMTGNAGGTIRGSLVGLTDAPLTMNGSSEIRVGAKETDFPAGVYFGRNYLPIPPSYEEFRPRIQPDGAVDDGLDFAEGAPGNSAGKAGSRASAAKSAAALKASPTSQPAKASPKGPSLP